MELLEGIGIANEMKKEKRGHDPFWILVVLALASLLFMTFSLWELDQSLAELNEALSKRRR